MGRAEKSPDGCSSGESSPTGKLCALARVKARAGTGARVVQLVVMGQAWVGVWGELLWAGRCRACPHVEHHRAGAGWIQSIGGLNPGCGPYFVHPWPRVTEKQIRNHLETLDEFNYKPINLTLIPEKITEPVIKEIIMKPL